MIVYNYLLKDWFNKETLLELILVRWFNLLILIDFLILIGFSFIKLLSNTGFSLKDLINSDSITFITIFLLLLFKVFIIKLSFKF